MKSNRLANRHENSAIAIMEQNKTTLEKCKKFSYAVCYTSFPRLIMRASSVDIVSSRPHRSRGMSPTKTMDQKIWSTGKHKETVSSTQWGWWLLFRFIQLVFPLGVKSPTTIGFPEEPNKNITTPIDISNSGYRLIDLCTSDFKTASVPISMITTNFTRFASRIP